MGNSVWFLLMRTATTKAAGESIRALRELAGLTLAQVAQLTGRSPSYLSMVENGKAANVTDKYIANTIGSISQYIANPVSREEKKPAA